MNSTRFSRLYVYVATATWVTVVIGLMLINLRQIHEAQYAMATSDAREHVNEDNAFRFWVASMGGVYAPVTDRIQPNANLSHVPERDIKTPTGKSLTLINSAYLLRLIMTDYADLYGIRGHLAGLTPSRKETAPDEWEKAALLKFQEGIPEISKVVTINGVPYVRLMKPMYVKEQCLECHTHQNYTVGNVAGGVSVAVPLGPYLARMQKEMIFCAACYGIVLAFGLAGILLGRNRLIHHVEERDKTENALRGRTAELVKVNADLRIEVEERKRAEDAFRESEATLRQIIDLVPHMIFVKDWDGKYLLVNKAVAEANNMSVSDLTGKYHADLHSDSSELQNMLQDDRAVMMTGEMKFIPEESYTDAQGNLRFHQATKVPFHIFGDKKPAVLGVAIDITKSKRAEAALHESERRLRTILQTVNEGFWLIDNDTSTVDLNPRMCAIMDRNREEVLGRKIFDFVDNENKDIFEAQVKLRAQGQPGAYEIGIVRPDGSNVFCQFNVTPFFDGAGNKVGAFAMVTDISERKRAEDALRDNEEKFRSIFDNSLEGILFSAPDGSIFAANRAACEMLGRSEREICEGGRDLVVDMTDPRLQKCLEERKRTGRFLGELNHRRKDGTAFPVEISMSQFSLTNGDLRACIIFRDITERKRMEKSVLESEQRFRMIAETIRDVFWITTPDSRRMIYVSPAYEPLWGRSSESLYQAPTSFLEAVHPDDQQTLVALLKDYPEGNWDCEYRIIQQDGGIRWIHAREFPVRNEANEITRMIGIASDITRRKQAEDDRVRLEQRIKQAQKAESLGRMAGAIAHLFNNHLAVVIGNLELAMMDLPGDALIRKDLIEAMRAARRSADVSGLMLTYLGHSTAKPELLDLSEVCRTNLPILRDAMPEGIALETDFLPSGPVVRAHANQMQQILTHLITNGWESIGHSAGTVTLASRILPASEVPESYLAPIDWKPASDLFACLEVTDTGCGMAEEDLTEIFDPFFTTKFTGRGLGLAVVLGIVKTWGGAIGVKSEKNQGSIFRVFLPLVTGEIPRLSEKATQTRQMEPGGTVLLVEDQDTVRNMAESMLKHMGYQVLAASGGAEAVELFSENPDRVSFVITDLTMPVMNGWETLTALRKIRPHIPVILVSGHDEACVMAENYPKRPHVFLHKPYLKGDMEAAIDTALKKRVSTG